MSGDFYRLQAMNAAAQGNQQQANTDLMMAGMMDDMERQRREEEERERIEAEQRRQAEILRQQQEAERRRIEAEQRQQNFDNYMTQGMGFAQSRQFELAIQAFDNALRIFPRNAMAKVNKAVCMKNSGDFKNALTLFLELAGGTDQVPNLGEHITFCENELVKLGIQCLDQAKTLYSAGSLNEAKAQLSQLHRIAPKSSAQGQQLLLMADELDKQIFWDELRGRIVAQFTEAKALLAEKFFQKALDRFKHCAEMFREYQTYLNTAEQSYNAELSVLMEQANQGVKYLKDVQLQTQINSDLTNLQTAVAQFNLTAAVEICGKMVANCKKISNPQNVASLGYIGEMQLEESLRVLNHLVNEYNAREVKFIQEIDASIRQKFAAEKIILSADDLTQILNDTKSKLHDQWPNLDSRNLASLKAKIIDMLPRYTGKINCLLVCFYGYTDYIVNRAAFNLDLEKVIGDNIPADNRSPIVLEIFNLRNYAQVTTPPPMFYSSGVQGAQGAQSGKGSLGSVHAANSYPFADVPLAQVIGGGENQTAYVKQELVV